MLTGPWLKDFRWGPFMLYWTSGACALRVWRAWIFTNTRHRDFSCLNKVWMSSLDQG